MESRENKPNGCRFFAPLYSFLGTNLQYLSWYSVYLQLSFESCHHYIQKVINEHMYDSLAISIPLYGTGKT